MPPVSDILARVLASSDATVGGGSASALAGAMAAGLAGMVARLSVGRGLEFSDAEYEAAVVEADALARTLHAGAEEDAGAYSLVKNAYRLPRGTEADVTARELAVHDALIAAALVPLENARRSLRVLDLCVQLGESANEAAASDLAAAWLLADAAVQGCLLNVDVNLEHLTDSMPAARLRHEADSVRIRHARLSAPPKERA